MSDFQIPETLEIPHTLAAGPGPGNTDERVLARFAASGVADHMHPAVLQGMVECKEMLRQVWGTDNTYTFGVAGTGWSGLDMMFNAVLPGDKVVIFANGTFSGIDALSVRMKAATREELAANSLDPQAASVTVVDVPHGESVTGDMVEQILAKYKPRFAAMAHWETGSGRVNDIQGFSDACEKHGVMGLIDAVSSLGVENFRIDDYPGIHGWASCPQKGICALPLTYAPVSFTDHYIAELKANGAPTFCHHPILEARHWGIIDGQDVEKGTYHRTHSAYAVCSFHEALRLTLQETIARRAASYEFHEAALKQAVTAMGCEVTSNMTSLIVLNLPGDLAGREMEFVQSARAKNFGIWPTLSAPVQVRIGILNQLTEPAIREIIGRFGDEMIAMGADVDMTAVTNGLDTHYRQAAIAAE